MRRGRAWTGADGAAPKGGEWNGLGAKPSSGMRVAWCRTGSPAKEPRSVKFSTSGHQTADRLGELLHPRGLPRAPPRAVSSVGSGWRVKGPGTGQAAGVGGAGRAGPGVSRRPGAGPLKDLEQEACAIPWLRPRRKKQQEPSRVEPERGGERGGRAESHPGLCSALTGLECWVGTAQGLRCAGQGWGAEAKPQSLCSRSPRDPGEAWRRPGV